MVAQNMLPMYDVKQVFSGKNFGFDDVSKCLQQIEIPDLFHMCKPCSELPSYISTKYHGIMFLYCMVGLRSGGLVLGFICKPYIVLKSFRIE